MKIKSLKNSIYVRVEHKANADLKKKMKADIRIKAIVYSRRDAWNRLTPLHNAIFIDLVRYYQ